MYKLIRFFNQNRKKIVRVILIIAFAFIILQILNYLIKIKYENDNEKNTNVIINQNNSISNYNNSLISDKSMISGSSISSTKLKSDTDIIDKFMTYCNNKELEKAYDLLSEDCKDELFNSKEEFNKLYLSKLFDNKKTYIIENWTNNTYSVRITEDILSTGNLNNNITKQDYITIVEENNEKRLNINNYIGRTEVNKVSSDNNIKITVLAKDTYFDYEIYSFKIENNSNNMVLLDSKNNTKSIYLLDNNGMKYYFYNNEIPDSKLKIQSQGIVDLKIKFNKAYSSTREIKSINFLKVVLDYKDYMNTQNKDDYDFKFLKINL